jgi:hypothetical protein
MRRTLFEKPTLVTITVVVLLPFIETDFLFSKDNIDRVTDSQDGIVNAQELVLRNKDGKVIATLGQSGVVGGGVALRLFDSNVSAHHSHGLGCGRAGWPGGAFGLAF